MRTGRGSMSPASYQPSTILGTRGSSHGHSQDLVSPPSYRELVKPYMESFFPTKKNILFFCGPYSTLFLERCTIDIVRSTLRHLFYMRVRVRKKLSYFGYSREKHYVGNLTEIEKIRCFLHHHSIFEIESETFDFAHPFK